MHGDSGLAMDKASEYLARNGAETVDAVVCLESSSGKGVAEALERAGAKDSLVVAMDADTETLNRVKEGDRLHHLPKALHHGLLRAEGHRRCSPLSAQGEVDDRLRFGIQLTVSGVCGYRRLTGRLKLRGQLPQRQGKANRTLVLSPGRSFKVGPDEID